MIDLYEQPGNRLLGQITEDQLQFLIDQMEEESLEDQDYAITAMTLDFFESQGAEAGLLTLLREALSEKEEISIRWARD